VIFGLSLSKFIDSLKTWASCRRFGKF